MRTITQKLPLLLAFWLLGIVCAYAQPNPKPWEYGIRSKEALEFFLQAAQANKSNDYSKAIELYQQALKLEPNFAEAHYRLGLTYLTTRRYKEANAALRRTKELTPYPIADLHLYIAHSIFYQDKYVEAQAAYSKFIAMKPTPAKSLLEVAERNKKCAEFAIQAVKQPITFNPINLGDSINTDGEEYMPCLTADGQTMFFTSRRPGSTGGFNQEYNKYLEDFYVAERTANGWGMARNFGPPINTVMNEGAATFSADGQFVVFGICDAKAGDAYCDLYISRLNGKTWSTPQNLGPIVNSKTWDSQPSLSSDGQTLFFTSTRPGGEGGEDIWYTRLLKGSWTEPQNLGKPVNTPGAEVAPFLHADGNTLFFASDHHPGFGGFDLFTSTLDGSTWSQPKNLGYPLNTSASEGNIFVTTRGDTAYYDSDRESGKGHNIYVFELDKSIRPNITTYVCGFVTDSASKKPLDATVLFVNVATGDTVRSAQTNSATGKYLLTLPPNGDYAAFIDKKGYLFASRSFSLKNIDPATTPYFDVDIALRPLTVGTDVIMRSVFFETSRFNLLDASSAELDHLYNFMNLNRSVKVEIGGHTDNVGAEKENDLLAENRAQEVRKYLIAKGIQADRITAKGYGERQPIATNDTPEGRALNRRTVCKIVGI
jgi:outer membrane protein OmpA-like peptidoglycan-associated protein/tetratricopeptide (TPR) repeat protein